MRCFARNVRTEKRHNSQVNESFVW